MGTDPLRALDRVRELRGHDPINPYRIDGEEALSEEERAEQDLVARMAGDGPGADEGPGSASPDGQASPPSPLIPQVAASKVEQVVIPQTVPDPETVPDPDFVFVMTGENYLGGVKGREVTLTHAAAQRIKDILLSEWQHNVMAEVRSLKGRRRKPAVTTTRGGTSEGTVEVAAPTLRRRGRPKGSKNKKVAHAPEPTGNSAG